MKNKFMPLAVLAALLSSLVMLASCQTTESASSSKSGQTGKKNIVVLHGSEQNPLKLQEKQMLVLAEDFSQNEKLPLSNWSKVRMTSAFLDALKLHEYFTNEEKYELMCCLFDDLPQVEKGKLVREVRVGAFFSQGKDDVGRNLIVRIGIFPSENKDAAQNSRADAIVMLLTNALSVNGEIMRGQGAFLNTKMNAGLSCAYKNGLLTDGNSFPSEPLSTSTEGMDDIGKVMLAQSLIQDDDLANDAAVKSISEEVIANKDAMPAARIMAMIMRYEYFVSIEDISQAEKQWAEIIDYCPNVPGDMNPENLEAMNGESLYLMRRLLETVE